MTEFISFLSDSDTNDEVVGIYPSPPCDGYIDNIELWYLTSAAIENGFVSFGYLGNVENFDNTADGVMGYYPTTGKFHLQANIYGGAGGDPQSRYYRKYFGKKRLYVKAGKPLTHAMYCHNSSGIQNVSVIRGRFVPQKGSIVQFRTFVESLEEKSNLNSLVDKAYNLPISMMYGAVVKAQITIEEVNGTEAVAYGRIVFRHVRQTGVISDAGRASHDDHTSFGDISAAFSTVDREIVHTANWSIGPSEAKTGSTSFVLPTAVHEGDLLTAEILFDSTNSTVDIDLSMEVHGRAAGYSNYVYQKFEGTAIEDLTEVSD